MHHFFTKIRNHQTVPVRQKRWRLYRLADFVVQMVAPCLIPTYMMNLFLGKNCIILNACFHQRQSQSRSNNQKCRRIRSGEWKSNRGRQKQNPHSSYYFVVYDLMKIVYRKFIALGWSGWWSWLLLLLLLTLTMYLPLDHKPQSHTCMYMASEQMETFWFSQH